MADLGTVFAKDDLITIEGALRDACTLFKDRALRHMYDQEALFEHIISEVKSKRYQVNDANESLCHDSIPVPSDQDKARVRRASCSSRDVLTTLPSGFEQAVNEELEQHAFHAAQTSNKFKNLSVFERMQQAADSLVADDDKSAAKRLIRRAFIFAGKMRELREPERKGLLAELVASKMFSVICMICIALNAVFLIYSADYEMARPNKGATDVMTIIERSFVGFYIVELVLKLCVHRLYFFWCEDANWNMLDLGLVCLSLFEMVVVFMANEGVRGINYSFMRCLKLFKLAKVLRVVRSLRFFAELRLMFDCVLGSIYNMVWCLAMILFIVYIFGLLIVQSLAQDLSSPDCPYSPDEEVELRKLFGSVGDSMLTLIQSTTGGHDWGSVYGMIASGSGILAWSYLTYIVFFALAAWNIVTSLFVDKALKLAQPDIDTIALERNMQDAVDAQELTSMFNLIDADGSGRISLDELQSIMHHPKFRTYLRVRGIEVTDAELFHRMLLSVAGGDDLDIDIQFIVAACLRMKGNASSMDLHALSFESKLMSRRLQRYIGDHSARLNQIQDDMATLVRAVSLTETEPSPTETEPVRSLIVPI